jgi:hypothetical protein
VIAPSQPKKPNAQGQQQKHDYPGRVGQIRPSQLMFTFGIGSVIDLPNFSAVVAGLDDWDRLGGAHLQMELLEPRLLAAVRYECGRQVKELRTPARAEETQSPFDLWARIGVPVLPFPRWLRCTACSALGQFGASAQTSQFSVQNDNPYRPDKAQFIHTICPNGKKSRAVPARVVAVCPNGHLDEFPWMEFVHQGPPCAHPRLKIYDSGSTTRPTDSTVECTACKAKRQLSHAFHSTNKTPMPACRGRHAHLRHFDTKPCPHELQPMLLGASNLWFPVTRAALSLPGDKGISQRESERLRELIQDLPSGALAVLAKHRGLERASDLLGKGVDTELALLIDFNAQWQALKGFRPEVIEQALGKGSTTASVPEEKPNLLVPEWRLFDNPASAPKDDPDFQVREVAPPTDFEGWIQRTVLVERLREVMAMIGFTRIDSAEPDDDGESTGGAVMAPLVKSPKSMTWVPAAETRGEGIFIQLPEERVRQWADRVSATERIDALRQAHHAWRSRRGLEATEWPGARYLLLHTLAHALINELALECGYSAASIRERIYAAEPSGSSPAMAGILLYTAAPDSEGTLGGLVSLGEPDTLGRLLRQAIEKARLCSTDPMCAEHVAVEDQEVLHNAACHACVLVPETSCEGANRYLDRAVLADTLAHDKVHYFDLA